MKQYTKSLRKRITWLFFLIICLMIFVAIALVPFQVFPSQRYRDYAEHQYRGIMDLPAERGGIYDRNRVPLALSVNLPNVVVNPAALKSPESTARYLSLVLGEPAEKLLHYIKACPRNYWLTIARKIDKHKATRIADLNLPGVFIQNELTGMRFYPKGRLACQLLGYVDIDEIGVQGMELSYNTDLQGKPGQLKYEADERGRAIPHGDYSSRPALPGRNLVLTIDSRIQHVAERELRKAVKSHQADSGTIVIYDPNNGEILAMANQPDYTPGCLGAKDAEGRVNRAIQDAYEPGSTFKLILAAAALDSGRISETDQFYSGPTINVEGWPIGNAMDGLCSPSGYENVEGVITYSFNTGAASMGLRLGRESFYRYIEALGFNHLTGADIAYEVPGYVRPLEDWHQSTVATVSFGQGVTVTPLQMVRAVGCFANRGIMMTPHLAKALYDDHWKLVREFGPITAGTPISHKTAAAMTRIMCNVVTNGTGKAAAVPGYAVAGKTGTAQCADPGGGYSGNRFIASFIGFVPAEEPRVVILVKVDNPKDTYWGGTVAAPIFRDVAREVLWYLKVPPTQPRGVTT